MLADVAATGVLVEVVVAAGVISIVLVGNVVVSVLVVATVALISFAEEVVLGVGAANVQEFLSRLTSSTATSLL